MKYIEVLELERKEITKRSIENDKLVMNELRNHFKDLIDTYGTYNEFNKAVNKYHSLDTTARLLFKREVSKQNEERWGDIFK